MTDVEDIVDSRSDAPHRIAVVGSGPRGLSVVERLGARLATRRGGRPVEIHLIDSVAVGTGRVWRTAQPDWFLMNTVAGQISAYSGLPDDGPARPGAGPSLEEWWREVDPAAVDADGYAPRAVYGGYMRFILDSVVAALPADCTLHEVTGTVRDLEPVPDGYLLHFTDGAVLAADRVVLTTGHSQPEPTPGQRELAAFAADRPNLRYFPGDSAADMPLDAIPAGSSVGVLGLGLSFYDVMAALTIGRGGVFTERADGRLSYRPSGLEPLLVAGSRSGMPLPARGRNQKATTHAYRPVLFTAERIGRALTGRKIDFRSQVLPWLLAEVDLVYYATALRQRAGSGAAAAFTAEVAAAAESGHPGIRRIADRHGVADLPPIDLDRLARPFAGQDFPDPDSFRLALQHAISADLAHAAEGNVDSPLKAALDVLRDTRTIIRTFVDWAALAPASHRDDFLGWYVPRSAFLAAGPPMARLGQVSALIDCGLLRIIGPEIRFSADAAQGRFLVSSPRVAGPAAAVETVIDARIPAPDLDADLSPLTRRLRERGIWTCYVNTDGDELFRTGGVAVTKSPYHPIGLHGVPDTGLYVLGIPTEHTRWFMQAGSSRPGMWSDFVYDADDIAEHSLAPALAEPSNPAAEMAMS